MGEVVEHSKGPRLAFVLGGSALVALGVFALVAAVPSLVGADPSRFTDLGSWFLWFLATAVTVVGAASVIVGLLVAVTGSKRFWPVDNGSDTQLPRRTSASSGWR